METENETQRKSNIEAYRLRDTKSQYQKGMRSIKIKRLSIRNVGLQVIKIKRHIVSISERYTCIKKAGQWAEIRQGER